MRLPRLVARNLRRRPLATALTTLSVALGVGLFSAIGSLRSAAEESFQRSAAVCDLVVGAKGSPLQLVLNALYHMGASPGNIPFALYEELLAQPAVRWAVPVAVGDSYRGQRVVGVTGNLFRDVRLPGDEAELRFESGEGFAFGHEELVAMHRRMEEHFAEEGAEHDHDHLFGGDTKDQFVAVVGSRAAEETGLWVGSTFRPVHDLQGGPGAKTHEEALTRVIGVLAPTGTPLDRAIYIPLGAFYSIAGHQPADSSSTGGTRDPLGLSAVLVRTGGSAFYKIQLQREINDRLDAQAARPVDEIRSLFRVVGDVDQILRIIAALVVVVALVGVLVAIYNTMGARRREFAVLRALGARRRTVLAMVMGESAAIALAGGVLGMVLAGAGMLLGAASIRERTGVSLGISPGLDQMLLLGVVALVGALAGLVPALSAYRTEAARYLSGPA